MLRASGRGRDSGRERRKRARKRRVEKKEADKVNIEKWFLMPSGS